MKGIYLTSLFLLLSPIGAHAAPQPPSYFSAGYSLLAASSSPGNAYIAGTSVVITAPTMGDLLTVGGSVVTAGPISGDTFLLAGSISTRAPVTGDLRVVGGNISIAKSVGGDLVALGYNVGAAGYAQGNVFLVGANVSLTGGANGPVVIYGNNVLLAGQFTSDVKVVAGGSVRLAEDTSIEGRLTYEAPDTASVPASAVVMGGIEYTNASYLPNIGTSRALALASLSIFLLVRILGALILAGLLAGLFPTLAQQVADRMAKGRARSVLLTTLLGFAAIVATPILLVMMALTFVGLGVAVLLGVAYALLLVLAGMYSGILLGTLFVRRFKKRKTVVWHDGVLGMLILSLVALVPIVGLAITLLLMAFTAGTLLSLFFDTAFPHEDREEDVTQFPQ